MSLIVHKFGGTSVGDARCFANVARILLDQRPAPSGESQAEAEQVVVVSAMSGVTAQLVEGGRAAEAGQDRVYRDIKAEVLSRHLAVVDALMERRQERLKTAGLIEDRLHELEQLYRSIAVLGEFTVRGQDAVTSIGEQLSATLLAALLRQEGCRAEAVNAAQVIVTDSRFGAAHPLLEPTRRRLQAHLRPLLERGLTPVVTGYVAANEQGVTTTLGRGGSDYSAALIGAGLDAAEVWIWTDVNGILTADPNLVPLACTLDELSYTEAAELAYYGAEVLHPKTIRPVLTQGIPLRIRNSFAPEHPGTLILGQPGAGRRRLPAIISTTGLSLIAIGSQDDAWALPMAARALQCLGEAGLEVLMFSQSFSEHNLNLVVRERDQQHCLYVLCREFDGQISTGCDAESLSIEDAAQGKTISLGTREKAATVSVTGAPDWQGSGAVRHAFAALSRHGTRVIAVAQSAGEHSISFCIPEDQLAETVRFLHSSLGLDEIE